MARRHTTSTSLALVGQSAAMWPALLQSDCNVSSRVDAPPCVTPRIMNTGPFPPGCSALSVHQMLPNGSHGPLSLPGLSRVVGCLRATSVISADCVSAKIWCDELKLSLQQPGVFLLSLPSKAARRGRSLPAEARRIYFRVAGQSKHNAQRFVLLLGRKPRQRQRQQQQGGRGSALTSPSRRRFLLELPGRRSDPMCAD